MTTTTATHASASAVIPVAPDRVFGLLTDVDRLPSWNTEITAVLERPRELVPGAEWVVEMHAAGMTWPSRTRVITVDPDARRFVHRSVSDDGNPSFTIWTWTVTEAPGGARVTVSWDPNPRTFWRRHIVVHWRRRCLRRQVPRSLRALAAALRTPVLDPHRGPIHLDGRRGAAERRRRRVRRSSWVRGGFNSVPTAVVNAEPDSPPRPGSHTARE